MSKFFGPSECKWEQGGQLRSTVLNGGQRIQYEARVSSGSTVRFISC